MNGFDLFKMAVGNLLRRKGRTMLTVLGIVIGTISIVLMIGLGLGMQESINEQFASQSSAGIIEVTKGDNVNTTTRQSESEENDNLQDLDISFLESIDGIQAVSPVITTSARIVSGSYEGNVNIMGLETTLMDKLGYEVYDGRLPEASDGYNLFFGITAAEGIKEVASRSAASGGRRTAGGGGAMPRDRGSMPPGGGGRMTERPGRMEEEAEEEPDLNIDIYNDRISLTLDTSYSPQGGSFDTDAQIYRIKGVGLLEEGDRNRDSYVYMDIDNLIDLMADYDNATGNETDEGFGSAYVLVEDMDDVEAIAGYIEDYGYATSTSADFLETLQGTTETLTIALGAIGAVSLLVAAIGITNTMNMAINERKKEIGVMKVIGATIRDIKWLFLTEAAIIGFLGGIFGIGFSYGASVIISSGVFSSVASGQGMGSAGMMGSLTNFNVVLPGWLMATGMVFTTLIGVVSGYIPARNAMKSSALEAIKTE